ncbi:Protocadherin Fat 4 [Trichinella pseudospiralis]|uniref:Protocadherin Fat 4 n=2 Tax=Trichinella pseudospiralis TaxID=6337 RepID=A0A0V1E7Z9_TRIPS|nr:Protocadherin Fat 4 [Trichinella pseudospiralis]KRZ25046.1 Protocadherin Fat 4 [Trichinella pseudospiralis]
MQIFYSTQNHHIFDIYTEYFQNTKMMRNNVLLFVLVIWLLIGGAADAGCPVSSTEKNFGGKVLEKGGCLTVVDISEPQKLYGETTIDHLHRFCMESFKGGKLLSFTDSRKLQILAGANFKKDPTSTILLHPGIRVFESNSTERQNVFVEKCLHMESLRCRGYPYEYISTRNETASGMLFKCEENKCCGSTDCDDTASLLTYESELLENFSDLSADAYCRCIAFNPTYLEWNLSNEHTYHCDHMKCDVFVCQNDEYMDCKENRVKKCSYSSEAQGCKEFTYEEISEKELPYGQDCGKRNYGESCLCPCGGTWTEWSIVSGTCGVVISIRYRPRLDMVATNKSCDGAEDLCCKETKDNFVSCSQYKYDKVEYEKFKVECEQHNGVVNASEAELVCVCLDDQRFGKFCEKTSAFDTCSERQWCENGGTCRNYEGSYRCDCMVNYSGKNCSDIIKTCLSNAECMNGGICALLHSGKACKCTEGFLGANCELKIGSCEADVCMNEGSCVQVNNNTYKCDCSYKYEGTFCEEELGITEIFVRLIKTSLTFQIIISAVVLIILVSGIFFLFKIAHAYRIFTESSTDRLFRRARELRKDALDKHEAKQKGLNAVGHQGKSAELPLGKSACKVKIMNKSVVMSSESKATPHEAAVLVLAHILEDLNLLCST